MDKQQYLGGWRENKTHCYLTYHKMSNEEISKVIEDENFRLHKGINETTV
jgi:hypothetical protein